jgi:pimeloyl-ACP methyl ester carboxylesterase
VLFVLARRDQMTPLRIGVEFAKHLPQARVVQLGASGHFVMVEGPDATLDALKEFLA